MLIYIFYISRFCPPTCYKKKTQKSFVAIHQCVFFDPKTKNFFRFANNTTHKTIVHINISCSFLITMIGKTSKDGSIPLQEWLKLILSHGSMVISRVAKKTRR